MDQVIKKILIVDDSSCIHIILKNFLEREINCQFDFAFSAKEAQNKIFDKSNNFDLVITDVNMPGSMNGIDLVENCKSSGYEKLPFLVVTAETSFKTISKIIDAKANDYILKPFEAKTITDKAVAILKAQSHQHSLEGFKMHFIGPEKSTIKRLLNSYSPFDKKFNEIIFEDDDITLIVVDSVEVDEFIKYLDSIDNYIPQNYNFLWIPNKICELCIKIEDAFKNIRILPNKVSEVELVDRVRYLYFTAMQRLGNS